jgi:hypothetical protein
MIGGNGTPIIDPSAKKVRPKQITFSPPGRSELCIAPHQY